MPGDAIAFEPHADVNRVEVAIQGRASTIVIEAGDSYVTKDPGEVAELDKAEGVKRVARAETKADAKAKAEAKS